MFCKNCGKQMVSNAAVCVNCGVPAGAGNNFCPNCGAESAPQAVVCTSCGVMLNGGQQPGYGQPQPGYGQPQPGPMGPSAPKSKMAAGLLGIFLGAYGVHNFYLGYMTKAIIQVSVSVACFLFACLFSLTALWVLAVFFYMGVSGIGIWGLIEGIMILTGAISTDGHGQPLRP